MQDETKTTPLYEEHLERGAKIANFGGYNMPLWYSAGPKDEHLAVVKSAGIFDTSHMAAVSVKGKGAHDLLQRLYSKDLNSCIGLKKGPLEIGKCVYGVFLKEDASVIDDAIVYMIDADIYTIIVNAGMGSVISTHLQDNSGTLDVEIEDLTDKLGKIDIQGPDAAKIVENLIQSPEQVLEKLSYFNFKGFYNDSAGKTDVRLLDGTPILLSRTGYTGEFGFEIFIEAKHTLKLWECIFIAAEGFEALPCGLAARDSLRTGAVLPLSHQDIGSWPFANNPWLFALPLNLDNSFSKNFTGSEALRSIESSEYTHAFAGFDPRKVIPGKDTVVVDKQENSIGTVLTCVTDMAISRHEGKIFSVASKDQPENLKFKGLCCGFVKTSSKLNSGQKVYLKGNKRKFKVEIVDDIRPARTARIAMAKMRSLTE